MASRKKKKERKRRKRERKEREAAQSLDPQPPAAQTVKPSAENQSTAQPAEQTASKQNERESPSCAEWSVRWQGRCAIAQVFLGVCLVIFTAGQAIYGYRQWDATNNQYSAMLAQNKITEKQLNWIEMDQRPYLMIEPKDFKFEAEQPIECSMIVKNIGKTPAVIKGWGVSSGISKANVKKDTWLAYSVDRFQYDWMFEPQAGMQLLAPGASRDITLDGPADPVLKELYDSVQNGSTLLSCVGGVKYTDLSGTQHEIMTCLLFDPSKNRLVSDYKYEKND